MRMLHPVAVVAPMVVLVAGCGTSPDSAAGWLNGEQASAEYRAAAAELTLPEGQPWPQDPEPQVADDGSPRFYEAGTGAVDAQLHWLCAWANGVNREQVSREAAARQVQHVAFDSLAISDHVDQSGRVMLQQLLADLQSGQDTQLLRDASRGTCGG